jgi:hypothetical protein
MATSPPPDKRMLMGIPIDGSCFNRRNDLVPGLKTPAFERQRTQDLPPGFDQVQIRRVCGLIDELEAGMMDHEQQQVMTMMHLQVVQDGTDALLVWRDVLIDTAEKVDEMCFDPPGIALRPACSGRFLQGAIDVALGSAPIIDLLFGAFGWTSVDINGLLTWITFCGDWSHLINV